MYLRSDMLKINHSWVVTWFFPFFFRLGILVKLELYCHCCFNLMVIYVLCYLGCCYILPSFLSFPTYASIVPLR